jgi:hypothetical protein
MSVLHGHRYEYISSASDFAKTELEYILMLVRSIFDLLQEALASIWNNHVELLDPEKEAIRKRHKLKETFSDIVLQGNEFRTAEELETKYALPRSLAEAYVSATPFFAKIRDLRNSIVHYGRDLGNIFTTDRGFCVNKDALGFGDLPFWKPEHAENENLVSLLPLLAHIVLNTIAYCGTLVGEFCNVMQMLPAIAPDQRVFVRGPHNESLIWLAYIANGDAEPWWSERANWKAAREEVEPALRPILVV